MEEHAEDTVGISLFLAVIEQSVVIAGPVIEIVQLFPPADGRIVLGELALDPFLRCLKSHDHGVLGIDLGHFRHDLIHAVKKIVLQSPLRQLEQPAGAFGIVVLDFRLPGGEALGHRVEFVDFPLNVDSRVGQVSHSSSRHMMLDAHVLA